MKTFGKVLLIFLISSAIGYAAGVALTYFLNHTTLMEALTGIFSLIGLAIGACVGGGLAYIFFKPKEKTFSNEGETQRGDKMELQHDSKFMTVDELKKNPGIISTTWQLLPQVKHTGFLFRSKVVGGKYEVAMMHEKHALIIGTTGTGKTAGIVNPTIRVLAHSAEKPSIIMTDPKGELYEDNYNVLKQEGYNILVLDLNDPYSSSRWNPMEIAWRPYQRAANLYKEVRKYSGITPQQAGFATFTEQELQGIKYGNVWYGFEGKAFPNEEILKHELESVKDQLEAEAKSILRNIAMALVPVPPDSKDPIWPSGCQDLVTGIMQGMLEDSRDERLGMTLDKFNFYNLYKIATRRDAAPGPNDSQLVTLSRYSDGRDPIKSSVHDLMATVCGTSPVTQRSFLATLGSSLGKTLSDEGIQYMTSGTDIDFEQIPLKPTAFFLRVPDYKKERHPLAVLCIEQLYKVLVDQATRIVDPITKKKGKLPRKVYFILDEFGNMPAVNNFDTMVTVSRSRNIFFEIILQSYKQLDILYGADKAQTIRGNFQLEVFLGSEDPSTIEAFSKACGETTVFHKTKTESKSEKADGSSSTTSIERVRRPLVDPAELRTMKQFTMIAKIFGQNPYMEEMTPFFKVTEFTKNPAQYPTSLAKSLDIGKVRYDIEERNRIVLPQAPRSPFTRF